MHFLAITLFELGQYLRIVLWIALPMVMLSMLATVYVHFRKRHGQKRKKRPIPLVLGEDSYPEVLAKLHPSEKEVEAGGQTVYQGLLWMKKKYEQDRELADEKYGRLKEEFTKLEGKYLAVIEGAPLTTPATPPPMALSPQPDDRVGEIGQLRNSVALLEGENRKLEDENRKLKESHIVHASSGDQLEEKNLQIGFLQSQLDQRIKSYHELEYRGHDNKDRLGDLQVQLEDLQGRYGQALQLLDERQTTIGRLQEQLQQGSRRSEALSSRLESGNRMLLRIRQELDRLTGEEYLSEEPIQSEEPEHPMQLEPVG